MTIYHLHGDEQGESRLTPIELTLIDANAAGEGEGSANRVKVLPKFPAYDLGLRRDRRPPPGLRDPRRAAPPVPRHPARCVPDQDVDG